jgi:hypothetical protein
LFIGNLLQSQEVTPSSHHSIMRWLLESAQELNAALVAYLSEITEKVIREEVHGETGDAEEVDEPTRIGR